MTKIAILQSNYIPWKGYFDLINSVDMFVIYDVVQYTKNDWRNRNRIIVNSAPAWLTIPVSHKSLNQRIDETKVSNNSWAKRHWKTITQNYGNNSGFKIYGEGIGNLYRELESEELLSSINVKIIRHLCDLMGIKTEIISSSRFKLPSDRVEKILHICKELKAQTYISGPAAKAYLNTMAFENAGIECKWFDYSGYREYAQNSSKFEHSVSMLDLLFCEGEDFGDYMKTFQIT